MQKLVLDTNVVVSSCISEFNPPGKIIDELFMEGKIALCISQPVLAEYVEVLNRKKFSNYKGFAANAQKFLLFLSENGLWFEPETNFQICTDPDDDILLDLAFAASADFVVNGNLKHFPMKEFHGIPVLSPAEYWNFFRPK